MKCIKLISCIYKTTCATISLSLIMLSVNLGAAQAQISQQNHQETVHQNDIYEQAKKDLPDDSYLLYRLVERMARANSLDDRPWRIKAIPEYNINAFATDVNLIAVYSGMVDQLSGDTSALACVVGHEMAHNVKRHIALSEAQITTMTEQLQREAEQEVGEEVSKVRGRVKTQSILGGIFGVNTSVFSRRSIEDGEKLVQQIVAKKKKELETSILEQSRKHELEADELGYFYMARAGFEPAGCLRVMEVLARMPGAELDTSHPNVPTRIKALQELINQHPSGTLAAEGKAKISSIKPLTYDLSEDRESLRVNSRFGSSQNDLDRLFGQ